MKLCWIARAFEIIIGYTKILFTVFILFAKNIYEQNCESSFIKTFKNKNKINSLTKIWCVINENVFTSKWTILAELLKEDIKQKQYL